MQGRAPHVRQGCQWLTTGPAGWCHTRVAAARRQRDIGQGWRSWEAREAREDPACMYGSPGQVVEPGGCEVVSAGLT